MINKSISLLGVFEEQGDNRRLNYHEPVKIDKNCISCSTYKSLILKAFKIAWLYYNPSNVKYNNKMYTREEIIRLRIESLKEIGVSLNVIKFPNADLANAKRSSMTANADVKHFKHKQRMCHKLITKVDVAIDTNSKWCNSKVLFWTDFDFV